MQTVYVETTVISYYAARVRAIVEAVNNRKGYNTPIICTPEELMEV